MNKKILLASAILLSTTACSEYWWSRGQPPSTSELFERKQISLEQSIQKDPFKRSIVIKHSEVLSSALDQAVKSFGSKDAFDKALNISQEQFIALEGKVSIGSRAAFGELSGQLRTFAQANEKGSKIDKAAFTLFSARTLSFLASEISVPAPNFG